MRTTATPAPTVTPPLTVTPSVTPTPSTTGVPRSLGLGGDGAYAEAVANPDLNLTGLIANWKFDADCSGLGLDSVGPHALALFGPGIGFANDVPTAPNAPGVGACG